MNGEDQSNQRATAQKRVALVMWARSVLDDLAARRAYCEVHITLENGVVTYVRTTEGKKPPPSLCWS